MTKEELRAAMPITAAIVDDFRKHFGELNAITAKENNQVVKWRKSSNAAQSTKKES